MSEKKTGSTDLYGALGIDRNASAKDVKRAYRKLARQFHPDNKKTGDIHAFRLITQAYETLKDEVRREHYDRTGEIPPDDLNKPERDMSGIYEVVISCFLQAVTHEVESDEVGPDGKKKMVRVNISTMNILAGAKEINRQRIQSMVENRAEAVKHLSHVAEVRRRLKFKGEGFDPLENFYRKEEEETAAGIKEVDKSIARWKEGGEFLNNYEYLFDGPFSTGGPLTPGMLVEGYKFLVMSSSSSSTSF